MAHKNGCKSRPTLDSVPAGNKVGMSTKNLDLVFPYTTRATFIKHAEEILDEYLDRTTELLRVTMNVIVAGSMVSDLGLCE